MPKFEDLVTEISASHDLGRGAAAAVAAKLRPDLAAVHQAEVASRPAPGGDPATHLSDDDARRAWERDATLRAEFGGDLSRFRAYRAATAAGRAKISVPRTVTVQQ